MRFIMLLESRHVQTELGRPMPSPIRASYRFSDEQKKAVAPPSHSVTVELSVSQWHRLEDFARLKGRNRGEILASALDEYIVAHLNY